MQYTPDVRDVKPICQCANCEKLSKRSLEQLLKEQKPHLRTQCAKLVQWLCKELLASSSPGFRFDRDHSFFGGADPLNECSNGLFLPTVEKACRALGLELRVFAARHVMLFESYFVALPNDAVELEVAKARMVHLAGLGHAQALGWSHQDFMTHIRGQDSISREKIAEMKLDTQLVAENQLILEFLKQKNTLLPKFQYIYDFDYEFTHPIGKPTIALHHVCVHCFRSVCYT